MTVAREHIIISQCRALPVHYIMPLNIILLKNSCLYKVNLYDSQITTITYIIIIIIIIIIKLYFRHDHVHIKSNMYSSIKIYIITIIIIIITIIIYTCTFSEPLDSELQSIGSHYWLVGVLTFSAPTVLPTSYRKSAYLQSRCPIKLGQ